jgi:hypothetical protein
VAVPVEFRYDEWLHECARCGLRSHDGKVDRMAYWSDGVGNLVCFCGDCAKREFDWPPDAVATPASEPA